MIKISFTSIYIYIYTHMRACIYVVAMTNYKAKQSSVEECAVNKFNQGLPSGTGHPESTS